LKLNPPPPPPKRILQNLKKYYCDTQITVRIPKNVEIEKKQK